MNETRVVYWGTYDPKRSRNRIIVRGLRSRGIEVIICHSDVWAGIADRSTVVGIRGILTLAQWMLSYPGLIRRYLSLPGHQVVVVGYPGHLDVLIIWPFAKMRGAKIVWNTYISLYDTVVGDRRLVADWSPVAGFISIWEWLGGRAADLVLLDTNENAKFFAGRYAIVPTRIAAVLIGVEPDVFPRAGAPSAEADPRRSTHVLYFGQMIPLHGLETILEAAALAKDDNIHWTLVGRGQEEARVRTALENGSLPNVSWVQWLSHPELIDRIHDSDICLGIFGRSGKASRVIANKVFEAISSGKPLITRDSPAIRELLSPEMPGIRLVRPGDPNALLAAVRELGKQRASFRKKELHRELLDRITPEAIGADLLGALEQHNIL